MCYRVQFRLALLLVGVTVLMLGGLILFQRGERRRVAGLLERRVAEETAVFHRLVELDGRLLETFANDYTYWDEMVDGIARSDTAWADDNIAQALSIYKADAAWTLRPDRSLFYQTLAEGRDELSGSVPPESTYGPLLEQGRLCHFFFESPAGLMEVRGATVHPSADPERKTAPQGFFLVGRLWDEAYLDELGRLFNGDVRLVRPGQDVALPDERIGLVVVWQELSDWRGRPLARVEARTVSFAVRELQRAAKQQLVTLVLMAALCVSVVAVGTFVLVSRPIEQLARSIRAGSPAAIQGLVRDRGELGQLARVLEKAFRQRTLLQASEERYRELVEGTSDMVHSVGPDGRMLFVNRAWRDTLGYTEDEVAGMNLFNIIAPEALAHCQECFGRVMAGETFKDIEAVFLAKDGHRVQVSGSVSVKTEDGRPVYTWGIFRDITERRQAEKELRISRARLATIFNGVSDGIFHIDTAGRVVEINAALERMTGLGRSEVVGRTVAGLVGRLMEPRQVPSVLRQASRVLKGEPLVPYVVEFRNRMLEVSVPARNSDGSITGVVRDVTEQRKAAEALRQSEERFRALFELAPDAYYVLDAEGRFVTANQAAERIVGGKKEEFIGRSVLEAGFVPKQSLGKTAAAVARNALGLPVGPEEFVLKRPDGEQVVVEVRSQPVTIDGRRCILGVARDITERKRAEQALAELTEELKRSNAELEQFAYVASHDLQEPLRMVGSYTQLLARRYKGKLDADADEFIAFAVDGVTRMQRLINDLLTYSRVGTRGKTPEPTDAEEVFNRVLRNLAPAMEEAGATVTHDRLPEVMADEVQLGQLLQNLVGNAIKYHGDEPPRVHVRAERSNGTWMFSVKDNGIGIAPQYHERIFQIFQRLHTRREYEGTGIGLAVCRKIVERHHGRIWVESQEGGGADFRFTLPATGEEV